ncbi:MAG: NUDIX domain-containing protein [Candidatus Marinimicrobia bacterium]|nr:NUDIX domain-containing protein [Candidatus Neomarinimicrobiota bacterium]
MTLINKSLYKKIIKSIPILCIDLIVIHNDKYLLIKRNENPLKDEWWVPGGRVLLGEKIEDTAKRKLEEEIGTKVNNEMIMHGIYEDFFDKSSMGEHLYHTLSIVFKIELDSIDNIKLDSTSNNWALKNNLPCRFEKKMRLING